jgi:hypothetical protein
VTAADDRSAPARTPLGCTECGALLAVDQRYCVECGHRAAPLPHRVGASLQAIAEPHRPPLVLDPVEQTVIGGTAWPLPFTIPTPRATAAAVLSMLAFGVAVGAGNLSLASSPIIVAVSGGGTGTALPLSTASVPHSGRAGGSAGGGAGSGAGAPSAAAPAAASSLAPATGAGATTAATTTPVTSSTLPPVKHVFLIMLGQQGYAQTFGPTSADRYLSRTLAKQGELVPNYYAVAQSELANEIATISGQGPTPQTELSCPRFTAIRPARRGRLAQVLGNGCVYPRKTQTLAGQLTAAHDTWKAYIEGLGTAPKKKPASCLHPTLGAADRAQSAASRSDYVTWHNPFVYFRSVTATTGCSSDDIGLPQLDKDLESAATTPTVSYIAPGPCDDGTDTPCRKHAKGGLVPADAFLRSVVSKIKASAAYKDGGLILITFAQAPQTGPHADPSSCCNTPTYPNLPSTTPTTTTTPTPTTPAPASTTGTTGTSTTGATTTPTMTTGTTTTGATTTPTMTTGTTTTGTTTTGTTPTTGTTTTPTTGTTTTPLSLGGGQTNPTGGGGQVGLLVISSYVKPNTTDVIDYFDHYSLLGSVEKLLGLKTLGYASDVQLSTFGGALFSAYAG